MSPIFTTTIQADLALEVIRRIYPDIKAIVERGTFNDGIIRFLFQDGHEVGVLVTMTLPESTSERVVDAAKRAVEAHNRAHQNEAQPVDEQEWP